MWMFLLSPLGRKIGIAVLAVLLLFWAYRQVTNHAYEQGKASGRAQGIQEIQKQIEQTWKREREAIEQERMNIEQQSTDLRRERTQLDKVRTNLEIEYKSQLASIVENTTKDRQYVETLPPSQLIPAVRSELTELRSIEQHK